MTRCGSKKNIFAKNQDLVLLALKCKLTPTSSKSAGACANLENNAEGLFDKTRADMCILGCLLFMCGIVPNFRFAVLVAASQKT
jgi:hypothetical protein